MYLLAESVLYTWPYDESEGVKVRWDGWTNDIVSVNSVKENRVNRIGLMDANLVDDSRIVVVQMILCWPYAESRLSQ